MKQIVVVLVMILLWGCGEKKPMVAYHYPDPIRDGIRRNHIEKTYATLTYQGDTSRMWFKQAHDTTLYDTSGNVTYHGNLRSGYWKKYRYNPQGLPDRQYIHDWDVGQCAAVLHQYNSETRSLVSTYKELADPLFDSDAVDLSRLPLIGQDTTYFDPTGKASLRKSNQWVVRYFYDQQGNLVSTVSPEEQLVYLYQAGRLVARIKSRRNHSTVEDIIDPSGLIDSTLYCNGEKLLGVQKYKYVKR